MKRSLSPQSGAASESQPQKKRLISVFSALKNVFLKLSSKTSEPSQHAEANVENGELEDDNLPDSFVSRKRKLLIQEDARRRSLAVPRTSVSVPVRKGMLESLYDHAQLQNQNSDVLGEFARSGSTREEQSSRNASPSQYAPGTLSLPKCPEHELNFPDFEKSNLGDLQPLMLHSDYTPPDEYEQGNIIRPPFINLNPRERHHLLQMKKSLEVFEFFQGRLKYMADPDETTSIHVPNNKVETSTQTYTKEYLDNSLTFDALRTKLALQNRKQRKAHKRTGFFSGDFFYDPPKVTQEKIDLNLKGALGSISRPQFAPKTEKKTEKLFPDADISRASLTRRGSVSQRPGLESTIRFGKTQELFDKESKQNMNKVPGGIQSKDPPVKSSSVSIGPSSAFKFDIQKDKVNSVQKKESENGPEQTKIALSVEKPKERLFEFQTNKVNGAPNGATPDKSIANDVSLKSGKPFSFGLKPDTKQAVDSRKSSDTCVNPALATPSEVVSQLNSLDQENTKKPLFSFGNNVDSDNSVRPAISVAESDKNKTGQQSMFDFNSALGKNGAKSSAFSFGNAESNTDAKPKAIAEINTKPPVFSFGAIQDKNAVSTLDTNNGFTGKQSDVHSTDQAHNTKIPEKSVFKFGSSTSEDTLSKEIPKFNFGSVSKPFSTPASEEGDNEPLSKKRAPDSGKSLFANNQANIPNKKDSVNSGPAQDSASSALGGSSNMFGVNSGAFVSSTSLKNESQGNTPSKSNIPKMPNISFEKPQDSSKGLPKFLFGQTSDSGTNTPSFSFANAGKPDAGSSSLAMLESKDAKNLAFTNNKIGLPVGGTKSVTLGNQKLSEPKHTPSFSFGNQNPAPAPKSTPSFSFGQSATADPAQIFGGSSNGPAPAFNFSVPQKSGDSRSATSLPAQFGSNQVPFGSAPGPGTGFSFSNAAVSAFGNGRPVTPANTGQAFATDNRVGGPIQASNLGGFNSATAPSSVFGGTSRSVTPNFGGFGQPQNGQPGMTQPQSQSNGFSFSGPVAAGPAFTSAPGSFGQASREGTPPAFGNPMGDVPPPGVNFSKRKLAHMRPRRR